MDGTPIREFKNLETKGVPFPKNQPMRIYSSLWNAEDWATRGGLVKTDWSKAPFTASYRNFNSQTSSSTGQSLDATGLAKIHWVQKNYMIYNYCTDIRRFPQGLPPECSIAWECSLFNSMLHIIIYIKKMVPIYVTRVCLLRWFTFLYKLM